MHRSGSGRCCSAHGTAKLLANGAGVDCRAPFDKGRIDRELIDALPQADLVSWLRVAVGQEDERRAIEKRMRRTVHHVGRAGAPCRETDAGRAGDLAPSRREHRAGRFLLHQDEAHVALARSFHQFDGLAARMPDEKRCPSGLESIGHHFNSCRHS